MRTRPSPDAPLFQFLYIDAADVANHPHAIRAMYDKQLDGMIIRNVLPRETIAAVAERLGGDAGFVKMPFPMFASQKAPPHTLGAPVVGCDPEMREYFAHAGDYRHACRALFAGQVDFEARVEEIFRALSGGLPIVVPEGPHGGTYTSSTIRVLPEGHEIGVHVGNEFLRTPQASHLKQIVDPIDQLSFFVPLSVPEGGGELVVYGLEWDDVTAFVPTPESRYEANVYLEGTAVFDAVTEMDSTAFAPGPGDMLIFDGGRYYHRVSHVRGPRARRTIGGFLAYSQSHDKILYWS